MNEINTQQTPEAPQTASSTDQSSLSWKIFDAFVSNGQLSVTENELREYAVRELKLSENINKIPPGFMEHLPAVLVAFMNMWSGWHFKGDFSAGKIEKEHYYQRFKKFLIHKLNSLLKGQFTAAMKATEISHESQKNKAKNQQPEFAPYAISLECPAYMLNTIVFSNTGDDIIMKQHVGSKWIDLSPLELVNWPYIEVSFLNDDLYFVRRQATEFTRYLNFLPHESNKNYDYVIEHAESFGQQQCYSYDMLAQYINVYLLSLKSLSFGEVKLCEIRTILNVFLEDVRNINVNNSIATNTVIRYRLSPVPYIRNKKLVKAGERIDDAARIGYCEIITPKIQLLLVYFKPKQIVDSVLRFEYTDKIKSADQQNQAEFMPKIGYKCTFCNVEFPSGDCRMQIIRHIQIKHKMEQHVCCTLCKKQFEVVALAAAHWKHKCNYSVKK